MRNELKAKILEKLPSDVIVGDKQLYQKKLSKEEKSIFEYPYLNLNSEMGDYTNFLTFIINPMKLGTGKAAFYEWDASEISTHIYYTTGIPPTWVCKFKYNLFTFGYILKDTIDYSIDTNKYFILTFKSLIALACKCNFSYCFNDYYITHNILNDINMCYNPLYTLDLSKVNLDLLYNITKNLLPTQDNQYDTLIKSLIQLLDIDSIKDNKQSIKDTIIKIEDKILEMSKYTDGNNNMRAVNPSKNTPIKSIETVKNDIKDYIKNRQSDDPAYKEYKKIYFKLKKEGKIPKEVNKEVHEERIAFYDYYRSGTLRDHIDNKKYTKEFRIKNGEEKSKKTKSNNAMKKAEIVYNYLIKEKLKLTQKNMIYYSKELAKEKQTPFKSGLSRDKAKQYLDLMKIKQNES